MTRLELVKRLADGNPDLPSAAARRIVNAIFAEIIEALSEGRRVELRGFGAFWVKHLEPRKGRNPTTGVTVETAGTPAIRFRIGKRLHERLNPGQERN